MQVFASDAEKVVGVIFFRVRMATNIPAIRMQSSSNAQIAPASRSLPTKPPAVETDFQNLMQQAFQRQMAMMAAQMMTSGMAPSSFAMPTPMMNVNMTMPPYIPGQSGSLKRSNNSEDERISSKISKKRDGDVSESKPEDDCLEAVVVDS